MEKNYFIKFVPTMFFNKHYSELGNQIKCNPQLKRSDRLANKIFLDDKMILLLVPAYLDNT